MSVLQEHCSVFACEGDRLVGILHEPTEAAAAAGVLVVVGGPQYRVGSHRQFTLMARAFARAGFPVFRFDYRGMGDATGSMRTFEDVGRDLAAAIDEFRRLAPRVERVVVWGLCDGASAALMHAATLPRVTGLVLANPWARSESGEAKAYIRNYYGQRFLQASFWKKVLSGGFSPLASLRDFFRSLRLARSAGVAAAASGSFIERMRTGLEGFRGRVLMLISENDLTAAEFTMLADSDERWRRLLRRPGTEVVRIEGADHTFSDRAKFDAMTARCIAWLGEAPADGAMPRAEVVACH